MSCQRLEAFQSRGLEMKKKEKDKQNLASFWLHMFNIVLHVCVSLEEE
jgi:hypothetical protein